MQLFIVALIIVNAWHLYLVVKVRPTVVNANSVSESALASHKTFLLHRIIHTLCAAVFMAFAINLIIHNSRFLLPSLALLLAASFDIMQGLKLTSCTNHKPGTLSDPHQVSAWLMSVFYLVACILLLSESGYFYQVALPIIGILFGTSFWLHATKMKYFYIGQMIFFVIVSIGLGAASYFEFV